MISPVLHMFSALVGFACLLCRQSAPMRSLAGLLTVLLGLAFAAEPASAAVALHAEKPASGSAPVAQNINGENLRLSGAGVRENLSLAYDFASDDAVAARESTTLYRAVTSRELADIGANASRYRVAAGGTEGKYFLRTPEQASNFARMIGREPYTTTSVRVSPGELARGQPINPAREGPGYFCSTLDVPSGPVTIFNHSVLP